jgi:two-component system, chemotaxis family, chemotaxis protein CheY
LSVSLAKIRFLLVDDNAHMLNIIKTLLRGFGAEKIFEATSAEAAFERLKQDSIDIVILDYLMDAEDGVAFVRRLRNAADSPSPYVPVIMLTAHAERARVEAARDAGVTEFCTKPVTASGLLKKIATLIDRPRSFTRSDNYFGPDRRRHDDPRYQGRERRQERKP